jgi:hypothetical protein
MANQDSNFRDEYQPESEWAPEHDISQRTAARYRLQGLPYMEWGGVIYIHRAGGREFIKRRLTRRNLPRRSRQLFASI